MIDTGRYALYICFTSSVLARFAYSSRFKIPSSDLWVAGTVPNANDVGMSAQVQYTIGSAGGARVYFFFAEQVAHDFDAFRARFSILRPYETSRVDDARSYCPNQAFSTFLC